MNRRAAVAVWALEHLTPGGSDPALTGDLLEELDEGRPARPNSLNVFARSLV